MNNQFEKGDSIDVAAPSGGVASGGGCLIGSMFGVAAYTAAQGVMVPIWLVGCYTLPKNSAEAWTVGALIYWDATNHRCTTTVGSNKLIGIATAAAANPSSVGSLRLNGVFIS